MPRSEHSVLVAVPAPSPAPATGAGPNSGISVRIFDFWGEIFEKSKKVLVPKGVQKCSEVIFKVF